MNGKILSFFSVGGGVDIAGVGGVNTHYRSDPCTSGYMYLTARGLTLDDKSAGVLISCSCYEYKEVFSSGCVSQAFDVFIERSKSTLNLDQRGFFDAVFQVLGMNARAV